MHSMNEYVGESSEPIRKLGGSVKGLGYIQIFIFVIAIIISIMMASSITSLVYRVSSDQELIQGFVSIMWGYTWVLMITGMLPMIFIFKMYQDLGKISGRDKLFVDSLSNPKNLLAILIIVQIIDFLSSYFTIRKFLNAIAASNNIDDFARVTDSMSGEAFLDGLISILYVFILFLIVSELKNWVEKLEFKYKLYVFEQAGKSFNTVRTGFMIMIVGAFIALFPGELLSGLINLVGLIMIIVGLIKAGGRLEEVPLNLVKPGVVSTEQPQDYQTDQSSPSPQIQTPNSQEVVDSNFCTACDSANPKENKFCGNCGGKLN